MSTKRKFQISAAAVVVVAASALLLMLARDAADARVEAPPDRVITLAAKGYAFHAVGDIAGAAGAAGAAGSAASPDASSPSNPPLVLRAGERVRLVVRNDELADIEHNFKIPGLGVHCSRPILPGEEEVIDFTVPRDGVYTYTCCSHPGMGGRVEIEHGGGAAGAPSAPPAESARPDAGNRP